VLRIPSESMILDAVDLLSGSDWSFDAIERLRDRECEGRGAEKERGRVWCGEGWARSKGTHRRVGLMATDT
jgi:hypothetical protein